MPKQNEIAVLIACRRCCALCYAFGNDLAPKIDGQVAHINRNAEDSGLKNLCWLCLSHHNEYDKTGRQSKRLQPRELLHYQAELFAVLANRPPLVWPDVAMTKQPARRSLPKARGIVELYSRRIRVYRAAAALLGEVVREVYVSQDTLLRYARDTDEAIFLFDDAVAAYLFKLYQEAVRLQYLGKAQERLPVGPELSAKAEEQYQLLMWFPAQFGELRSRLVPYLRA